MEARRCDLRMKDGYDRLRPRESADRHEEKIRQTSNQTASRHRAGRGLAARDGVNGERRPFCDGETIRTNGRNICRGEQRSLLNFLGEFFQREILFLLLRFFGFDRDAKTAWVVTIERHRDRFARAIRAPVIGEHAHPCDRLQDGPMSADEVDAREAAKQVSEAQFQRAPRVNFFANRRPVFIYSRPARSAPPIPRRA